MARGYSVYRLGDLDFITQPPEEVCSVAFDAWQTECLKRRLDAGELGNESAIRLHWSDPAALLELPLIASIYDVGFVKGCQWSGATLGLLETELAVLMAHWRATAMEPRVRDDLLEAAEALRGAIRIARQEDGVLLIT